MYSVTMGTDHKQLYTLTIITIITTIYNLVTAISWVRNSCPPLQVLKIEELL